MKTTKRKSVILAWLFSLGWKAQAAIAIGLALMVTIVFHAIFGTIVYIALITTRTVAAISTITNIPPVDFLHEDFNVATNRGGVVTLDIPENANVGQWRIFRSDDLTTWHPVAALYTDEKSAEILMWTLYTAETNLTRCEAPVLFYKAERDDEP